MHRAERLRRAVGRHKDQLAVHHAGKLGVGGAKLVEQIRELGLVGVAQHRDAREDAVGSARRLVAAVPRDLAPRALGKGLADRRPRAAAVAAFDEALGEVVALGLVRRLLLLADEEVAAAHADRAVVDVLAITDDGHLYDEAARGGVDFLAEPGAAVKALVAFEVLQLDASTDGLHRSLTLDRLDLERLQHWDGAGVFLLERLFRGACSGHQRRSGRRERLCDRRRRVGGGRVAPRLASVREQESRSGGRGAKFCSLSLSQFVGHFGPAS